MAQASSNINADRGRANGAALTALCLLAGVQIALVSKAVWEARTDRKPAQAAPSVALSEQIAIVPTVKLSPPPVGQIAAPAAPPSPASAPSGVQSFGPPAIGSFVPPAAASAPLSSPAVPPAPGQLTAPAAVPPPPVLSAPAVPQPAVAAPRAPVPAAPAAKPVNPADPAANMSLEEMVELAKQVRGLGDMKGALEVLNKADLMYPGRPEVMAEMAQCYETMGLSDKAANLWKQLEAMDPARAAGYRDLAQRRLNSAAQASPPQVATAPSFFSDSPKILSLGACQAIKDPTAANGEKVVLRIPILRQGNTPVDPSQVDINVFFFDRVNGERVALTIADEPVYNWTAMPVDWSGIGEEPLDVTYFLPTLTPGEITAHGRRSYHGYVVRLYYQNKLQDVAAEPRDLLDFGSREPQTLPSGVNPLLPPVAQ